MRRNTAMAMVKVTIQFKFDPSTYGNGKIPARELVREMLEDKADWPWWRPWNHERSEYEPYEIFIQSGDKK
jgi:hypothetical protein